MSAKEFGRKTLIPIELKTLDDYRRFGRILLTRPLPEQTLLMRDMLRTDLFFLLTVGLGRKDAMHQWILDRCKEVEANPNGFLDLWARGHYKSTIITFALTIQDILSSHGENPLPKWNGVEVTIGIFSHTKNLSKKFVDQIKREFEGNNVLKSAFPDILWQDPEKEAPKWSLDLGLIVKRRANPKEATVEANGLVEGMPVGMHYVIMVYDDVVTLASINSPGMIEKTTEAWAHSLNLGSQGSIKRYIGTRYHFSDTYAEIIRRQSAIPRIHPATVDGSVDGEPVLMTREMLDTKRRDMGSYVYSSQMLQNPSIDSTTGFKRDMLMFHNSKSWSNMNVYILVDPANEKKKTSDYTAIMVVGLSADNNYYVLEITRDRLSLTERADELFYLHNKYKPLNVGYERYGMQADIAHIKDVMRRTNYNFKITELGGKLSKVDRIRKLLPLFETNRIYLPESCIKTNSEGKTLDLVQNFINEEYLNFPVSLHDDMLDALARILEEDLAAKWPRLNAVKDRYGIKPPKRVTGSAWAV